MKSQNGFTLIEMLVVISIIGVLTALFLVNFMGARERSSDLKLKADLNQLKTALRLYYNDFQRYPTSSGTTMLGCGSAGTSACAAGGAFAATTTYMPELPEEFGYNMMNLGEGFRIWVDLENVADQDIAASQTKCGLPTGATAQTAYVVCSD